MDPVSYTHLDVYKRQVLVILDKKNISPKNGDKIRYIPGRRGKTPLSRVLMKEYSTFDELSFLCEKCRSFSIINTI